eukprot:m.9318 g.9318  ORF g.9318 m.9318 type:complete len:488 (+) comp2622_c0_seq1:238-1701(+)
MHRGDVDSSEDDALLSYDDAATTEDSAAGGSTDELTDWHTVWGVALCLFFVHCQPSEAYLTKYLREDVGISEEDLDQYVWPVDTWTQLVSLVPAGLLAEVAGYRTVAVVGLLCRLATRIMLIWGKTVGEMAAMQCLYAIGTNADTILVTIMYLAVPTRRFQLVTGMAFAAQHAGSFVGSGIGQGMADADPNNLRHLFYVSWACTTTGLAFFASLSGPPTRPTPVALASLLVTHGVRRTAGVIRGLYRSAAVRRWAGWYLFAKSLNDLILNYYQNQIQDADANAKLGYFQMLLECCGVCGVALASAVAMRLIRWPTLVIVTTTVVGAFAYLLALDHASSLDAVCAGNAIAYAVAQFASTTASFTVAKAVGGEHVGGDNDVVDTEPHAQDGRPSHRDVAGDGAGAAECRVNEGDTSETDDDTARYAVVFACNGTLALVWASVISAIGTAQEWETAHFYRVTVIELFVFAGVMLVMEFGMHTRSLLSPFK